MPATETPITNLLPASKNPADLAGKSVMAFASNGDAIAFDAGLLVTPAKDLSMYSVAGNSLGARSTANMYVVRTTGTYKFPLVYGNGIEGGEDNAPAYTRQGTTYTANFVNHLDAVIASPFIEKNENCQAYSAGLLWQTGTGLITSVQLVEGGDCKYIQFTVGNVPATNGLAVLWVKDSQGRIMWSWTIWLTSDELGPDDYTNHSPADYQLMSENLGAIWNEARTHCVNPHYQWGRKDAFVPPASYASNSQMTVYDINNNVITAGTALGSVIGVYGTDADSDANKTVANAIKNPGVFFTRFDASSNTWCDLVWHNNFWNAAITSSGDLADNQASAVKTIYDPCPVGFMMPASRAFTGFTTTGDNTSDSSQFNVVVGSWANGWTFKKKSTDTVGSYYPASGYRAYGSGALTNVGSNGDYWAFAPYSQTHARYLGFDSGLIRPLSNSNRSLGFSVRPSREFV